MRAAIPGWSGTRRKVTFASFRSYATAETSTSSMLPSSSTTHVPSSSLKDERTCTGTRYFIANSTLRVCSTFAPTLASSSISS